VAVTAQADQLAALDFTTARHQLSILVRIGLSRRFRPHLPTGSAAGRLRGLG